MKVRTCPKCQSTNVHKSHRKNLYERWVLAAMLQRPYRCHHCNWRFYDYRFHQVGERQEDPKLPISGRGLPPE